MSWTKRDFVSQALEEIGLASYVFDLQPEQMDSALKKLDSMMASWAAVGVQVNYPLGANSDLDDETGVPDAANEAIYKNLAIRIAPSYGKAIGADTRIGAKEAYDALVRLLVVVPQMQLPADMPLGAGHKRIFDFTRKPVSNTIGNPSTDLEFINDN